MKKTYPTRAFPIREWAEQDRPREKLESLGRQHLSNAELLAILLGTGSSKTNAVGLARQILSEVDNNLFELGSMSLKELTAFYGIGKAKAITIAAALEIGRRRQISEVKQRVKIDCSQDAYQMMLPILADLKHEEFWVAMLNRANQLTRRERISVGGVAGTVVDAKLIFKPAIECLASAIILFHNHPSGNLFPSKTDKTLTQDLKQAGALLDVSVIDHIIIAGNSYYSFADAGLL